MNNNEVPRSLIAAAYWAHEFGGHYVAVQTLPDRIRVVWDEIAENVRVRESEDATWDWSDV